MVVITIMIVYCYCYCDQIISNAREGLGEIVIAFLLLGLQPSAPARSFAASGPTEAAAVGSWDIINKPN